MRPLLRPTWRQEYLALFLAFCIAYNDYNLNQCFLLRITARLTVSLYDDIYDQSFTYFGEDNVSEAIHMAKQAFP